MCGIAGFVSNRSDMEGSVVNNVLSSMLKKIQHRGPDNEGSHIEFRDKTIVAFGHQRLSIIDLSDESNQPTIYENLVMTFNGEIYNYIEIRNELLSEVKL